MGDVAKRSMSKWIDSEACPEGTAGLIEAQGFNPGNTHNHTGPALKGRQIWNGRIAQSFSTNAAPRTKPFLRPFRARRLTDTSPRIETWLKPWASSIIIGIS
jgi:hypothetical protein